MNTITRGLIGTVAAGAMAIGTATPAFAKDRHDGIDTGDVIAGALIIGGIAAIAAAVSNGDDDRNYRGDRYRDDNYRNNDRRGYNDRRGLSGRDAVELCVRAAEQTANRYSYGRNSKVTDIRDVDRKNGGFEVKGRIAVNTKGRNWRSGDNRYGNGWNGDYRGYNSRYSGYDSGSFKCKIRYGRVVDIDYSGIRGL